MQNLDVHTLKRWVDEGKTTLLVDVREPGEFEYCRIEGSINIPLSEINARFDDFKQHDEIVLICHHGARSYQAGHFLESAGLDGHFFNLDGGIDAWADQIDNTIPRY